MRAKTAARLSIAIALAVLFGYPLLWMVMTGLKKLDHVAYIRFASVSQGALRMLLLCHCFTMLHYIELTFSSYVHVGRDSDLVRV